MALIKLLILLFAIPVSLYADWTSIPISTFQMSPPPVKDSPQYLKDFQILHDYQDHRSVEVCKEGQRQENPSFNNLFGPDTGLLKENEIKKLEFFFSKIQAFGFKVTTFYKKKYSRLRPHLVDITLKPCIDNIPSSYAYPSGHAEVGSLFACILKEIFPEREKKLQEAGKHVGDLRFMVGVHHPSDVFAGQKLGLDICNDLLNNESFQVELKKYLIP